MKRHGTTLFVGVLILCASLPAAAVPLRGPVAIDVCDDGQHAIVAFRKDNSVAVIDLSQGPPYGISNLDARDGIGRRPISLHCVGTTAIVVHEYDTRLVLVDAVNAVVTGHVDVDLYSQDVVWDAARSRYYVSNLWRDRIFVYDASWTRLSPQNGIEVGSQPGPMALGPAGKLYVGNRASLDVSVVDPDAALEIDRVFLGSEPRGLAATSAKVLVTNSGGDSLVKVNGVPLIENDQLDIINIVTEIDPQTLGAQQLFTDRGANYSGIDIEAGLISFVGAGSGTVHLVDVGAPANALQTIDLLDGDALPGGQAPSGLRIFANTRDVAVHSADRAFTINHLRDTMVELLRQNGTFEIVGETALNPVGVPITAFQPQPAVNFNDVQNGERYFNTIAAWKRGQTDFTCSTCHTDGHTDFRMLFDDRDDPFGPGRLQGPERHPTVRSVSQTAPFAWEGSLPSLLEFNFAALDRHDIPPANPQDPDVFPDVPEFMVPFEETLRPGPNPFPRGNDAGRILFLTKGNCESCHRLPAFTDNGFHEVGTGRKINTPTLIGLWDRPPYLHDGRAATLLDVLDPAIYEPGFSHGDLAALSTVERRVLADYLSSIGPDTCIEVTGNDVATGLRVSKGPCPAHVVRQPGLDYLRTTLADVHEAGPEILLQQSTCLHDDRPASNLEVTADDTTAQTRLWVFLVRESGGPTNYGSSSAGKPRLAFPVDCPD